MQSIGGHSVFVVWVMMGDYLFLFFALYGLCLSPLGNPAHLAIQSPKKTAEKERKAKHGWSLGFCFPSDGGWLLFFLCFVRTILTSIREPTFGNREHQKTTEKYEMQNMDGHSVFVSRVMMGDYHLFFRSVRAILRPLRNPNLAIENPEKTAEKQEMQNIDGHSVFVSRVMVGDCLFFFALYGYAYIH